MKKFLSFVSFFAISVLMFCGTSQAWQPGQPHEKYTLEKIVILSRHNIRSPLTAKGGILDKATPHEWFAWTSAPGELSVLGGQMEAMMGQFFRKWLVSENFITENYIPKSGEFLFYANSKQRTIATAQFFSSGLLPAANVRIKHTRPVGEHDPVFNPQLTFSGKNYRRLALSQFNMLGGEDMLKGKDKRLSASFAILEKALDFQQSAMAEEKRSAAAAGQAKQEFVLPKKADVHFTAKDTKITLESGKAPSMRGTFTAAVQAADALVLQYYEDPGYAKTVFGHDLSFEEMQSIGDISNVYGAMLMKTPAVAANVANPLLKLIYKEFSDKKRRFSFLCGHDSNIASVLSALNSGKYSLPGTIETGAPIGGKLMFSKWRGQDGEEYVSVDMVYMTSGQIAGRETLSMQNPPASVAVSLQDIPQNEDGFYLFSDIKERFNDAIKSYRQLKEIAK
ncbi:MAG: histidine-type phosphatase [Elusimicrobiales bacterium]|nr:histidine-type phosphatase [Elusimicrobiales bacterium]